MTQAEQSRTSRSLAIYRLLLELCPRSYLQQHRAEMLQNFQDFEQASPSKAALWLFLGKDLAVSLRSQFTKTLWGQTVIVILVLAVLLVCTERHAPARVQPTEGFCSGYILGWFAGCFGKRWQASSLSRAPSYLRSLSAQAAIVLGILALVVAAAESRSSAQEHFIWALCYGAMLAWIAGWLGNHWQTRP